MIYEPDVTLLSLIQLRRETAENWETKNPILDEGEPGVEFDTLRIKLGDGKTEWNDLPYLENRPIKTGLTSTPNLIGMFTAGDFILQEDGVTYKAERVVAHKMHKYPIVTLFNFKNGEAVIGQATHQSKDQLTITLVSGEKPEDDLEIDITLT